MKPAAVILAVLAACSQPSFANTATLTGSAAAVFGRAQGGKWYADAEKLNPEIIPTSDGRSYLALWKATEKPPGRWIVSLHGSRGFATDDLAVWHPHLRNRDVGIVCVQWWIGTDDTPRDYYAPEQIYREIDGALRKLGVRPGTVMLHGFSRGSANSFAIAALDAGRGRKYFSLSVASSGGVSLDYPPTRAILAGEFGDHPLRGTRWITAAGALDTSPDRQGVSGMRRTAAWLREQGATVVETIEDPDEGHGALQRNAKNIRHVLDLFLDAPP